MTGHEARPRVYRADVLTRLERPQVRRRPSVLDVWLLADEMERRREAAPRRRRHDDDLPF